MMHCFKNPAACEDNFYCLEQFAKRVDGPPLPNQDPDHSIGWGLLLEIGFDWGRLIICLYIGIVSSLGFGIPWAIVRGSIQDGFAVATYIIGLEALAVATAQALFV
jgi:hypothetical protein